MTSSCNRPDGPWCGKHGGGFCCVTVEPPVELKTHCSGILPCVYSSAECKTFKGYRCVFNLIIFLHNLFLLFRGTDIFSSARINRVYNHLADSKYKPGAASKKTLQLDSSQGATERFECCVEHKLCVRPPQLILQFSHSEVSQVSV